MTAPRPRFLPRLVLRFGIVLLLGLSGASCGGGRFKATYPVKGRVLVDGEPAAGVTVLFSPVSIPDEEYIKPLGKTDEGGWFTLTSYRKGDGAPAGAYAVTLLWLPKGYAGPVEGGNKLPDRYRHPETSGIQIEVKAGDNNLDPFTLKR
jgi:hypothetical protein